MTNKKILVVIKSYNLKIKSKADSSLTCITIPILLSKVAVRSGDFEQLTKIAPWKSSVALRPKHGGCFVCVRKDGYARCARLRFYYDKR